MASVPWSMDYGGRHLITDLITRRGLRIVLEVGSFVGGSARQWLAASPQVIVVCVDPWNDIVGSRPFMDAHPFGRTFARQLREPDGLFQSFLSSMWDCRDRAVAVRGKATDKLPELHSLGLKPDLIYIDADKRGAEIALCDDLFPDALVGGDDWNWRDGRSITIRAPARKSARSRCRVLKNYGNTWLIDDRPWTVRERTLQFLSMPRSMAQTISSVTQQLRGRTSAGTPMEKQQHISRPPGAG